MDPPLHRGINPGVSQILTFLLKLDDFIVEMIHPTLTTPPFLSLGIPHKCHARRVHRTLCFLLLSQPGRGVNGLLESQSPER